MIKEDYVSFETAKLLKEKGFKEWCSHCYCTDVRHNGESISFDEELDLKDEGRESEIEYIDGGCLDNFGCSNEDYVDENVYAAPTLALAMKWLREVHNILLIPDYDYECTNKSWCYKIYQLGEHGKPERVAVNGVSYDKNDNPTTHLVGWRDYERSYSNYYTYEEACEAAIKYCLENLI